MRPRFRKAGLPRLSLAEQVRQGRAVRSAQAALKSTDAVRSFLNTHHDGLRARPLDLAVSSDAGLRAVEAAIDGWRGRPSDGR